MVVKVTKGRVSYDVAYSRALRTLGFAVPEIDEQDQESKKHPLAKAVTCIVNYFSDKLNLNYASRMLNNFFQQRQQQSQ